MCLGGFLWPLLVAGPSLDLHVYACVRLMGLQWAAPLTRAFIPPWFRFRCGGCDVSQMPSLMHS